MNVVLLETSGNQAFIFATNKLRENVGASELTYRAGTKIVLRAIHDEGGPSLWEEKPQELRDNLCNPRTNRPLAADTTAKVEVLTATSGKALLLVREPDVGRRIVERVTRAVLIEAPGIDLCGAVSADFEWGTELLAERVGEVHRRFEAVRTQRADPQLRFLSLPVLARCPSSGLPVEQQAREGQQWVDISRVSRVKRETAEQWHQRVNVVVGDAARVASSLDALEKRAQSIEWLAVVHADGNGLGKIFLRFAEHIGAMGRTEEKNLAYADSLRRFSVALEEATEAAFRTALRSLPPKPDRGKDLLPVVPLVLGGDDLTVVCDGRAALAFTRAFLAAFEEETAKKARRDGIIPRIAESALGCSRLSACAGVAIIKPHFPFYSAYGLAEELLRSAKIVKKTVTHAGASDPYPCSAIDFHVLYDSTFQDLDSVRDRLLVDGGATRLTAKPYVSTRPDHLQGADTAWAAAHHVDALDARVRALTERDEDGRRKLPSSQLHDLREGLFLGHLGADARMELLRKRYDLSNVLEGTGNGVSLFRALSGNDRVQRETRFLDALDVAAFWHAPSAGEESEG